MKTNFGKLAAFVAIIAVSYTAGKCNGISKLGKTVDEKLQKNHGLRVEKICYDFMKNKIEADIISAEKGEE